MNTTSKPTAEYNSLQDAYDYFNAILFGGALPQCMITLNRKRGAGGYFWPNKFVNRDLSAATDEIALNSDEFYRYDDRFILSILVHEMAHLWQQHYGKPSRNGYHNGEWVTKMLALGLRPISHDNPGKMTGQKVSHKIVAGGAYDAAHQALLHTGFVLTWQSVPEDVVIVKGEVQRRDPDAAERQREKMRSSKTKYTCPQCAANAWAKLGSNLICGNCMVQMEAAA